MNDTSQQLCLKSCSRRKVLTLGMGVAGALIGKAAVAKVCSSLTPAQTEGPFYPMRDQADKDSDLTRVAGRSEEAEGQKIILAGQVQDDKCQPVEGALVEIWQACHTGKYNHPGDPNPAKKDPNFQYWGRSLTNQEGRYSFKTIIPGEYQASTNWVRPPHIHMKVHRRGFQELTTQVYFEGYANNKTDRILLGLSPEERAKVVIPFENDSRGLLLGQFDITIKGV